LSTITRVARLILAVVTLVVAWNYKEMIWVMLQTLVVVLCVFLAIFAAVGLIHQETMDQIWNAPNNWLKAKGWVADEYADAKDSYHEWAEKGAKAPDEK